MHAFIRRNLDPATRLGEVLFGLIMALGFTASARLGLEETDNRALFVSILGCNIAWAIVDAVMYVLTELFERGRQARLIREIRGGTADAPALESIAGELDRALEDVSTPAKRREFYRHVLEVVRGSEAPDMRVRREDLLGAAAVALVIVLATLPVVVPFTFGLEPLVAVRLSNFVAVAMLFLLGARWAALVGASPLRIGSGLMSVGVVLVLITIALGG